MDPDFTPLNKPITNSDISSKPLHNLQISKKAALPIKIFGLLFLCVTFFIAGLMAKKTETDLQSTGTPNYKSIIEPTPTGVTPTQSTIQQNNIDSLSEVGAQKLTYKDDVCGLSVDFPQITLDEGDKYFWHVDASRTRTYIHDGRWEKQTSPDYSIVLFAKTLNNTGHLYTSSVEIICGDNFEKLTLNDFMAKRSKKTDMGGQETIYSEAGKKQFGSLTFNELRSTPNDSEYVGLYKNMLILVTNSNKATGKLQTDADSIISSISFK